VALDDQISIVVADVLSETYNAATLEKKLGDLDWVSRCGAAHHAVAEALLAAHAVLPLRLFTLFSSDARATAALRKSKARIARAFARVKDRQEWVLRIGKPDPALASTDQRAAGPPRSTSGTTFLQAKAGARQEEARRRAVVATDVVRVFETMHDMADEAATRPIPAGTNLLLDAAFLLPKGRINRVRQALTSAAATLLSEGCSISLTGPWPPYSFASLDKPNG
jgi:hypothetical protein